MERYSSERGPKNGVDGKLRFSRPILVFIIGHFKNLNEVVTVANITTVEKILGNFFDSKMIKVILVSA